MDDLWEQEQDEVCEWCNGTGVVYEDEYENGQIVGVATVDKACVCTYESDII